MHCSIYVSSYFKVWIWNLRDSNCIYFCTCKASYICVRWGHWRLTAGFQVSCLLWSDLEEHWSSYSFLITTDYMHWISTQWNALSISIPARIEWNTAVSFVSFTRSTNIHNCHRIQGQYTAGFNFWNEVRHLLFYLIWLLLSYFWMLFK